MIKQYIDVDSYWSVVVYYDIDYDTFDYIKSDFKAINISKQMTNRVIKDLYNGYAKAATVSNIKYKTSIVCFNKHDDEYDYVSSIVHEAEHVKQSMLKAYNIPDEDEPPAYTIGFLVMKMMEFYMKFLCR